MSRSRAADGGMRSRSCISADAVVQPPDGELSRELTRGDGALGMRLNEIDRFDVEGRRFTAEPPQPSRKGASQVRRLACIESERDRFPHALSRCAREQGAVGIRQRAPARCFRKGSESGRIRLDHERIGAQVRIERVAAAEPNIGQGRRKPEREYEALVSSLERGEGGLEPGRVLRSSVHTYRPPPRTSAGGSGGSRCNTYPSARRQARIDDDFALGRRKRAAENQRRFSSRHRACRGQRDERGGSPSGDGRSFRHRPMMRHSPEI